MSERTIYLNLSDGFAISVDDETDSLIISIERDSGKVTHTLTIDEYAVLEGCLLAMREKHKFRSGKE